MKIRSLFIGIILVVLCLFIEIPETTAQKTSRQVIYTIGVPTNCINGVLYVNVITGFSYTYKSGVGCFLSGGGATSFTGGTITSPILGPDGTAGAPTFSFSSTTNTGLFTLANTTFSATNNGTETIRFKVDGIHLGANNIAFGTSPALDDLFLLRDAADILACRRGTNPCTIRIYNTFTDVSNYERLSLIWSANTANLLTDAAGTGTTRTLNVGLTGNSLITLSTSGINFRGGSAGSGWQINTSGHLLTQGDNTYDIGNAAGTARPRSGYFGTDIVAGGAIIAGAASSFSLSGRSVIRSSIDGDFSFTNNAGTSFNKLNFGGTSASFPALRRNAAEIDVILADASNWAGINAGQFKVGASNQFLFANTNSPANPADAGLARVSAGVIKPTNGSSGDGAILFNTGGTPLTNYTESTCTLGVSFGGGTTGITYGTRTCNYTRIGNTITLTARISLTAKGSSTGQMKITGLPVAINGTAAAGFLLLAHVTNSTHTGYVAAQPDSGATTMSIFIENNGATSTYTETNASNTLDMQFTIQYFV